jgi:aconitate hydratase
MSSMRACSALFLDSITTDHISPAGSIKRDGPAGVYLIEHQVRPSDFNSYGARRGNHDVMMRGTFANIRIKNMLLGGKEGGLTIHYPSGEQMSIYDAAMRYKLEGVPLVVFAARNTARVRAGIGRLRVPACLDSRGDRALF